MLILLLLALLSAPVQTAQPVPRGTPHTSSSASSNVQNHGEDKKSPPQQGMPPLDGKDQPEAANNHGRNQADHDQENRVELTRIPPLSIAKDKKTRWDYVFDWGPWVSNLLLVLVGAGQVFLLYRTLRTIKRQADIQEANMRQWVDVDLVDTSTQSVVLGGANVILAQIHFKAVNNTPLPLTIDRIVTQINYRAEEWRTFTVQEGTVLPPNAQDGSEVCCPFFVPINLEGAEVEACHNRKFVFTARGIVFYEEASKRKSEREFSYVVQMSRTMHTVLPYHGQQPDEERHGQRRKPN